MKAKDKEEFLNVIIGVASPCDCPCHSKKMGTIMHMMPCCDRCYEKYND